MMKNTFGSEFASSFQDSGQRGRINPRPIDLGFLCNALSELKKIVILLVVPSLAI